MKRGEVWTVSGGKDYAGKPRPVVIVQDDAFDATDSVTVCAFTTDPTDAPLFRFPVEPNGRNGLRTPSRTRLRRCQSPKSGTGSGGWTMRTWFVSIRGSWSSSASRRPHVLAGKGNDGLRPTEGGSPTLKENHSPKPPIRAKILRPTPGKPGRPCLRLPRAPIVSAAKSFLTKKSLQRKYQ
jgi:mRNA interferase MazF